MLCCADYIYNQVTSKMHNNSKKKKKKWNNKAAKRVLYKSIIYEHSFSTGKLNNEKVLIALEVE